jgi:hypothetical protein
MTRIDLFALVVAFGGLVERLEQLLERADMTDELLSPKVDPERATLDAGGVSLRRLEDLLRLAKPLAGELRLEGLLERAACLEEVVEVAYHRDADTGAGDGWVLVLGERSVAFGGLEQVRAELAERVPEVEGDLAAGERRVDAALEQLELGLAHEEPPAPVNAGVDLDPLALLEELSPGVGLTWRMLTEGLLEDLLEDGKLRTFRAGPPFPGRPGLYWLELVFEQAHAPEIGGLVFEQINVYGTVPRLFAYLEQLIPTPLVRVRAPGDPSVEHLERWLVAKLGAVAKTLRSYKARGELVDFSLALLEGSYLVRLVVELPANRSAGAVELVFPCLTLDGVEPVLVAAIIRRSP